MIRGRPLNHRAQAGTGNSPGAHHRRGSRLLENPSPPECALTQTRELALLVKAEVTAMEAIIDGSRDGTQPHWVCQGSGHCLVQGLGNSAPQEVSCITHGLSSSAPSLSLGATTQMAVFICARAFCFSTTVPWRAVDRTANGRNDSRWNVDRRVHGRGYRGALTTAPTYQRLARLGVGFPMLTLTR